MSWELWQERFLIALESVRGTPEGAPSHVVFVPTVLSPFQNYAEPDESRGERWSKYRQQVSRQGATFAGDGTADPNGAPELFAMSVEGGVTPVQQTDPSAYLWEYVPKATTDDLATFTAWWGSAVQGYRSGFGLLEQLQLTNDANSEDGAQVNVSGMANFPTTQALPAAPPNQPGSILPGVNMELWIDDPGAIGTTQILDRLVMAQHTLSVGWNPKYVGAGAAASLDYSNVGADPTAYMLSTVITLEIPDTDQLDVWLQDKIQGVRVRHNGSLIGGSDYEFLEFDTYGKLKLTNWAENVNTNRVVEFTIDSVYDSTLGAPFRCAVQNTRST